MRADVRDVADPGFVGSRHSKLRLGGATQTAEKPRQLPERGLGFDSPRKRQSLPHRTPARRPALRDAQLPDDALFQRALSIEQRAQIVGRRIVDGPELVLGQSV